MTITELSRIFAASGLECCALLPVAKDLPDGYSAIVTLLPYTVPAEESDTLVDNTQRIDACPDYTQADPSTRLLQLSIASFAARNHYACLVRLLKQCVSQLCRQTALPKSAFRIAVNSGFPEKAWAQAAGLGFIGRSSLLVSPLYGPACIIGALLLPTDCLDPAVRGRVSRLEPFGEGDGKAEQSSAASSCVGCTLCEQVCPGKAIAGKATLPAAGYQRLFCIQHWTSSTQWPEHICQLRGQRLYGCDECIVCCPFTLKRDKTAVLRAQKLLLAQENRPGRHISADFLVTAGPAEIERYFAKTALGLSWLPAAALIAWARYYRDKNYTDLTI